MNPNANVNNTENQRPPNLPMSAEVRPNPSMSLNNPTGPPQPRPVRMEQPNPNIRMENYQQIHQQQQQQQQQQQNLYQQQRNMYQNYQQRPQMGDPVRYQSNQNAPQNLPPSQQQGQRMQMAFQPRFPGSQPQIRIPQNGSNTFPPPQPRAAPRPQNFPHMDPSRANNNQNHINSQGLPQQETHGMQGVRDPNQTLTRKSSNLELDNHQKDSVEIKPQPSENNEKPVNPTTEKEPPLLNTQQPISEDVKTEEPKNSNDREADKNSRQSKTKKKEKIKNDNVNDESITAGIVTKNIKFFEDNDTAKTPLRPADLFNNPKMKKTDKKNNESQDEESGVDDTPMIHPNLRSIYQAPRKVARIPHKKPSKTSRRSKLEKKSIPRWPFEERSKNRQYLEMSTKFPKYSDSKKKQKIEMFGPKEELLAFFQSSNSLRKLKRDGNRKSGESGSKLKVVLNSTTNGDIPSPKKTPSKLPGPSRKNPPVSPTKTPLKSPGTPGTKSLPKTPETPSPPAPLIKKVPMNKIQVGAAPSPNLKAVRSKVGSLVNTTHKPGGGNVRVETHKIDFSKTQPRIEAKNLQYAPSGGEKKITQVKLQWSAQSKVGSLENATYKPGGGDKKIESVKLDFKEKAKPKVGSKDNVKHTPGGGNIKIENQKLEFKAQSKVGSLDNVKHRPGGGDIKIFDDKTYLKQISTTSSEGRVSGTQSYGDLSVVREIEGRSAPGTPGKKTAVKIKKVTTIHTTGDAPILKNVTEVTVVSQTPKKDKNVRISPTKEHVRLTYSKFASPKKTPAQDPVGLIKIPANEDAPILKSNLGKRDASKVANGSEKPLDPDLKERKNMENFESSNLPDGKLKMTDDSGISKFLQDEMAAHEKVGEIWKETIENKQNLNNERKTNQENHSAQDSFYTNRQQVRPQGIPGGSYTNSQQFSNFNTNQNNQPQSFYRPPTNSQIEQNNQRLQSTGPQQQVYRISPQQQNHPYNNNSQYENNYSK